VILAVARRDAHSRALLAAAGALGAEPFVFDLGRFPRAAAVTLGYGPDRPPAAELVAGGRALDLSRVRAVWWWHPRRYGLDPRLAERHRPFALLQADQALSGLWRGLDVLWVNDPWRADAAQWKTWQLRLAPRAGLPIPRTLVTSSPAHAAAFLAALCGPRGPGAVAKSLAPARELSFHTRRQGMPGAAALEAVRRAPVILQERVPGTDLRATVVGRQIFAAEFDARGTAGEDDWRRAWREVRRSARPVRLPPRVARAIRSLVGALGLEYAALDLKRRPDGEIVFLEVNPAGRWLFVEDAAGLPITRALARLLVAADRSGERGRRGAGAAKRAGRGRQRGDG